MQPAFADGTRRQRGYSVAARLYMERGVSLARPDFQSVDHSTVLRGQIASRYVKSYSIKKPIIIIVLSLSIDDGPMWSLKISCVSGSGRYDLVRVSCHNVILTGKTFR